MENIHNLALQMLFLTCTAEELKDDLTKENIDINKIYSFSDFEEFSLLHLFAARPKTNQLKEKIEVLINKGADINLRAGILGYSPLVVAIRYGNIDVATRLIRNSIDLNCSFEHLNGKNSFILAAQYGLTDLIKKMFRDLKSEYKPIPDSRDENGWTALHHAASSGHADTVDFLVKKIDINSICGTRDTALHLAAEKGHRFCIEILLKNKANCNLLNANRQSPLHLAIKIKNVSDRLEICKMLVEAGAYPNQQDKYGDTPLHHAAEQDDTELIKYFQSELNKRNIKPVVNYYGHSLSYYEAAYSSKAELNFNNSEDAVEDAMFSIQPPHEAAAHARINIVKYYIEEQKISPEIADGRGYTMLIAACIAWEKGAGEVVDFLIQKGANIEHSDKNGKTPIFHAVENGNLAAFFSLFDANANLHHLDHNGENLLFPLIRSWCKNNILIAKNEDEKNTIFEILWDWLISILDMNATNKLGDNLIFTACERSWNLKNPRILSFLIEQGVSPWFANKDGLTAYQLIQQQYTGKHEEKEPYHQMVEQLSPFIPASMPLRSYKYNKIGNLYSIFNTNRIKENEKLIILSELLKIGATLCRVDNFGRPPFFKQLTFVQEKMPEQFEKIESEFPLGIELEVYQQYPLHEATQTGNIEHVRKLLMHDNIDPNCEDNNGKRAIDYARDQNFKEIEKLLLDKGAYDSFELDQEIIFRELKKQESPVLWMSDLSLTFGNKSKKSNKTVKIDASIHIKLRAFENLFRRKVESNPLLSQKQNSKFTEEEIRNKHPGKMIDKEATNFPNYAVAALTFVTTTNKHAKDGAHGRRITKPLFIKAKPNNIKATATPADTIKVTITDTDTDTVKVTITEEVKINLIEEPQNVFHVKDNWSHEYGAKQFTESCQKYADSAHQTYIENFDSDFQLDSNQPVDYSKPQVSIHSEQGLYEYLVKRISSIIDKNFSKLEMEAGYKMYALIIDIYTTREICGNCTDRTIGMQNLMQDGSFKKNLVNILMLKGIKLPKDSIKIVTRISSDHKSDGCAHIPSPDDKESSDDEELSDHKKLPDNKKPIVLTHEKSQVLYKDKYHYLLFRNAPDIKLTNNAVIFSAVREHNAEPLKSFTPPTSANFTIFTSQKNRKTEEKAYKELFEP